MKSRDGQKVTGGSHLVAGTKENTGPSEGHVASACYSPELGAYVALALLERGRTRHGETMFAANPVRNTHVAVEIISPHMVDPEGGRMHG